MTETRAAYLYVSPEHDKIDQAEESYYISPEGSLPERTEQMRTVLRPALTWPARLRCQAAAPLRHMLVFLAIHLASCGSLGAGQIAFSFDDAPWGQGAVLTGPERTEILIQKLDELGLEQVPFFCVGQHFDYQEGRKRLQQYAAAGHLLGNHSDSHSHPQELGVRDYLADVVRAEDSLEALDGFVCWYRFPYLDEGESKAIRDSLRDGLTQLGYFNAYVTVPNLEWYLDQLFREATQAGLKVDTSRFREVYVEFLWTSIMFYDSLAQACLGRSPKHVLLLHENDLAALFIDALASHIRSQGWEIITAREAYQDTIASEIPDALMNKQGRVAEIAKVRGCSGPFRHVSEDTAYVDSLVEASGIFK